MNLETIPVFLLLLMIINGGFVDAEQESTNEYEPVRIQTEKGRLVDEIKEIDLLWDSLHSADVEEVQHHPPAAHVSHVQAPVAHASHVDAPAAELPSHHNNNNNKHGGHHRSHHPSAAKVPADHESESDYSFEFPADLERRLEKMGGEREEGSKGGAMARDTQELNGSIRVSDIQRNNQHHPLSHNDGDETAAETAAVDDSEENLEELYRGQAGSSEGHGGHKGHSEKVQTPQRSSIILTAITPRGHAADKVVDDNGDKRDDDDDIIPKAKFAAMSDDGSAANDNKLTEVTSMADVYFLAVVAACSIAGLIGLIIAGVCWYKLQRNVKATAEAEYPAYGVTGPTREKVGSPGDRKLAQSAQMYHYQHQKQQMLAMEKANGELGGTGSDVDSEDENEEGDYTVYECPGLAPAGEMEVKNPLFNEDTPTQMTGGPNNNVINGHNSDAQQ